MSKAERNPDGTFKKNHQQGYKKGESGNPAGRSRKFHTLVSDAARSTLATVHPTENRTYAEIIGEGFIKDLAGDILVNKPIDRTKAAVLKDMLDRVEGKPAQKVEISGGLDSTDPEQLVRDLLALATERIGESFKS